MGLPLGCLKLRSSPLWAVTYASQFMERQPVSGPHCEFDAILEADKYG
jgi:hypothetical protein